MIEVAAEGGTLPLEEARSWRLLVRSFATLAAGETAASAFGLVGVLLLARRLGPSDFGIISFALSLVGWFGLVVDSGTEVLSVRDIAAQPHRFREITERVLGLRLALSIVSAGVFVAAVEVFARSTRVRDAVVLFAFMLPAIAVNLRWMVLGVGGAKAVAIGNVAARVVLALGILVFVHGPPHHHPFGLHRVPFLATAAELVYALVILGAVGRRFGLVVPKVDLRAWIATLRQSLPLLASALARAAFYAFDVVAIELIRGPHSVGIYTAASKPVLFITSAIGLFSISFLSSLSGLRGPAARRLLQKALRASLVLSIPIAAVLSAGSILIVPFLFGHAYERSGTILAVLAWRTPIVAATSLYGGVLITANLQRRVMRNNVLGALFLVAGDVAAIPLVGLMGAAVVSVAGAVLILVLNYSDARRLDPGSDPSAPVRKFGA